MSVPATLQKKGDNRHGQQKHQRGRGHGQEQNVSERAVHSQPHRAGVPGGGLRGQGGVHRQCHRLREHADRQKHQTVSVHHRRCVSRPQIRREELVHHLVNVGQRHPQTHWQQQTPYLPSRRVKHAEIGPKPHAQPPHRQERQQEVAEECPPNRSPHQPVYRNRRGKQQTQNDRPEDNARVVYHRPQSGNQELLPRIQDAHHQAAQEKEYLSGQQHPRQRHGHGNAPRVKAGVEQHGQRARLYPHHADQQPDHDEYHGRNDGNDCIRRPGSPLLTVLCDDGNDCRRKRAALQQVKKQVGNRKGGVVSVCLCPAPKQVRDKGIAQNPQHTRKQNRRHHQPGRAGQRRAFGRARIVGGRRKGRHRDTVYPDGERRPAAFAAKALTHCRRGAHPALGRATLSRIGGPHPAAPQRPSPASQARVRETLVITLS